MDHLTLILATTQSRMAKLQDKKAELENMKVLTPGQQHHKC